MFLTFLFVNVGDATAQQEYEYVDLGLPSGTLWATTNVGATKPEDAGDYFAWGETESKKSYSWSTYKYANDNYDKLTKYCNKSSYGNNGYTDSRTILEKNDDAVAAICGSEWCMPTREQFQELRDKCTWTWTLRDGKYRGYEIKGPNDNTIFLPAAGYSYDKGRTAGSNGNYWSSSLNKDNPSCARYLYFDSSHIYPDFGDFRKCGNSVRPVRCRN